MGCGASKKAIFDKSNPGVAAAGQEDRQQDEVHVCFSTHICLLIAASMGQKIHASQLARQGRSGKLCGWNPVMVLK
jgi:hypothetical protein